MFRQTPRCNVRFTKIRSDGRYYTRSIGQKGGEKAGVFLGSACDRWAIAGDKIEQHDKRFPRLLNGYHPITGERLRNPNAFVARRGGRRGIKGYDLTVNVPKSLSLYIFSLLAHSPLDGEREIAQVLTEASRLVPVLEERCGYVRVGRGGKRREKALVAFGAFIHRISRAGDPQIHVHLVMSATGLRENGKGGALDARPLFMKGGSTHHELGRLFAESLRSIYHERGIATELRSLKRGTTFELSGIPERLIQSLSTRRNTALIRAGPYASARDLDRAILVTRPPKNESTLAQAIERVLEAERVHDLEIYQVIQERTQRQHVLRRQTLTLEIRSGTTLTAHQHRIAITTQRAYAEKQTEWQLYRESIAGKISYWTGQISERDYQRLTHGRALLDPRTRVGIEISYATHQITPNQRKRLLVTQGHESRTSLYPSTELGICLSYATKRLSKGQMMQLLVRNGKENNPVFRQLSSPRQSTPRLEITAHKPPSHERSR